MADIAPQRAAFLAALRLFRSGSGVFADRLAIVTKDGKDHGGWGFGPLRDVIADAIKQAAREKKKRKVKRG